MGFSVAQQYIDLCDYNNKPKGYVLDGAGPDDVAGDVELRAKARYSTEIFTILINIYIEKHASKQGGICWQVQDALEPDNIPRG